MIKQWFTKKSYIGRLTSIRLITFRNDRTLFDLSWDYNKYTNKALCGTFLIDTETPVFISVIIGKLTVYFTIFERQID